MDNQKLGILALVFIVSGCSNDETASIRAQVQEASLSSPVMSSSPAPTVIAEKELFSKWSSNDGRGVDLSTVRFGDTVLEWKAQFSLYQCDEPLAGEGYAYCATRSYVTYDATCSQIVTVGGTSEDGHIISTPPTAQPKDCHDSAYGGCNSASLSACGNAAQKMLVNTTDASHPAGVVLSYKKSNFILQVTNAAGADIFLK